MLLNINVVSARLRDGDIKAQLIDWVKQASKLPGERM
jgi:hypothetical protein